MAVSASGAQADSESSASSVSATSEGGAATWAVASGTGWRPENHAENQLFAPEKPLPVSASTRSRRASAAQN